MQNEQERKYQVRIDSPQSTGTRTRMAKTSESDYNQQRRDRRDSHKEQSVNQDTNYLDTEE